MPSYKRKINAGIKLLNERFDWDWANVIDLDKLNLNDKQNCVLGQIGLHLARNVEGFSVRKFKGLGKAELLIYHCVTCGEFTQHKGYRSYDAFTKGGLPKVYAQTFGARIKTPSDYGFSMEERSVSSRTFYPDLKILNQQWKEKIQEIRDA